MMKASQTQDDQHEEHRPDVQVIAPEKLAHGVFATHGDLADHADELPAYQHGHAPMKGAGHGAETSLIVHYLHLFHPCGLWLESG
ncbi:hypothetical protein QWZ10_24895 [Paracoccus cavernae]|uniref:Uncharacterized protein n=1 Tax=Paracoccus cavernae TaxID=1571207 RepID=A0ABT8DBR4_9RHOB|nr:hypothetical protein [Paracoccus cavernae]